MPLNRDALPLEPDPASVKKARRWVREVLTGLRRDDIVSAAELGVSELVTNAILHGTPPITVRVRGTRDHPRVEIRDASNDPPEVNIEMTDEENLLATFGRGLGLVALHSKAWGAELTPEGKVVWFEPSEQPPEDADLAGDVFDLDETVQQRIDASGDVLDPVRVRFVDLPVALQRRFVRRYFEIGRELRLLSLAHGDAYPIARELAEVFLQVEQGMRLSHGIDQFNELLAGDADRGDVDLVVPAGMATTMARLLVTLEKADEFCKEQRLLVLAATPQELEHQRWYLEEFVRQSAGEAPRPWPGPFTVDDPAPSS